MTNEDILNENRRIAALRIQYAERINEIRTRHKAGMSRRTLIAHYGQDIVDLALAEGDKA